MDAEVTPRERVRRALDRQTPDRVPIDLGSTIVSSISKKAYLRLLKELEIEDEIRVLDRMQQLVYAGEGILTRFQIDTRIIRLSPPNVSRDMDLPDGSWRDQWGIVRRQSPSRATEYWDLHKSPLAGDHQIEDLKKYAWPDPHDEGRYERLLERATVLRNGPYAVVFESDCYPMTVCQFMRGWEDWFTDLVLRPEFVRALMEKVTEIQVTMIEKALTQIGHLIDVFEFGDDLGIQSGPMFSPVKYRELIKPWHKMMVDMVKRHSEAKVMYHNCGSIVDFIPDLIDVGIDILNPIQTTAKNMELESLKRDFGKDMSFWGGIDTQNVLPFGSPQQIRDEVRRVIDILGEDGGYVLAPSHNFQPEVNPENIIAMYEAALEYGEYR